MRGGFGVGAGCQAEWQNDRTYGCGGTHSPGQSSGQEQGRAVNLDFIPLPEHGDALPSWELENGILFGWRHRGQVVNVQLAPGAEPAFVVS